MNTVLKVRLLLLIVSFFTYTPYFAQSISNFKQSNKWGFKKGETIIIEPQYDTAFGFDQTGKVCLVGNINPAKRSINPLTKEIKIEYTYFYINPKNEKIYIKRSNTDSTFEVSVSKHTPAYYLNNNTAFAAFVGGKKYLVSKKGNTITNTAYDNIVFTKVPNFYITETKEPKNNQTYVGLIDETGNYVIQQAYSKISINTNDSLIYCCTAGIKFNGSDDVFNYKGAKVHSSARHIQCTGKKHAVYKLYESETAFVVFDIETGKEKPLKAEWVYYLKNEALVILDGDWYFYDMKTDKRFPIDKKLIKYYHLDE